MHIYCLIFQVSFLFYVIWPMRHLPISASRFFRNTTAKYRWFALFYLVVIFIGLPALAIGVSHVSLALLIVIFLLGLVAFVFVLTVNYMHRNERYNKMLPKLLQNDWRCLPLWMRSLEPLDRFFGKLKCCYGAQTTESKQVEIPIVTVSDKPSETV